MGERGERGCRYMCKVEGKNGRDGEGEEEYMILHYLKFKCAMRE